MYIRALSARLRTESKPEWLLKRDMNLLYPKIDLKNHFDKYSARNPVEIVKKEKDNIDGQYVERWEINGAIKEGQLIAVFMKKKDPKTLFIEEHLKHDFERIFRSFRTRVKSRKF